MIQLSSYGGQVAFPGNSIYHATKWGIEGFCESVAQEVAPFGHRCDDRRARWCSTEFRYGSAQVADTLPAYLGNPARAFEKMLDPANGLAAGDPARMATAIIDSVDKHPAPFEWCSVLRPSIAPSRQSRRGWRTSARRGNSPPPPTTRPANSRAAPATEGIAMKNAKLGDLTVARIGLGAMGMSFAFTGAGSDDAESIRTIHRALDLGVNSHRHRRGLWSLRQRGTRRARPSRAVATAWCSPPSSA